MSETQQTPGGAGVTGEEAAAGLAEIERRRGQVIRAVLVPGWYWWVFAAAIVAIGVARDSKDTVEQAVMIPLAVLVMVVLIVATTPTLRRRVQVNQATQPDGRAAAAIIGMIVLVDTVCIGLAIGLSAAHVSHPATIGCAAGAAVLVIVGTLVNRYLHRLMLSQARQQKDHASQAGGAA